MYFHWLVHIISVHCVLLLDCSVFSRWCLCWSFCSVLKNGWWRDVCVMTWSDAVVVVTCGYMFIQFSSCGILTCPLHGSKWSLERCVGSGVDTVPCVAQSGHWRGVWDVEWTLSPALLCSPDTWQCRGLVLGTRDRISVHTHFKTVLETTCDQRSIDRFFGTVQETQFLFRPLSAFASFLFIMSCSETC